MSHLIKQLIAVVPAAGAGKRMKANCPKQYLTIAQHTILEHTVNRLLTHPLINRVVLALGEHDEYIKTSDLFHADNVDIVIGGKERVDSVLAGLTEINADDYPWVIVHDAARPCVSHDDISQLISTCEVNGYGGILAAPVRDTMKRSNNELNILHTEERELLWHALTPQLYPTKQLIQAIEYSLLNKAVITDESSAIEFSGFKSQIVSASSENIKITHPDDLALAEFILMKQKAAELEH